MAIYFVGKYGYQYEEEISII